MNWLQLAFEVLAFLGSSSGANLVKQLEALGVDGLAVWQAIANHSGLPAIEAALLKLLQDAQASAAASGTTVNPVG